MAIIMSESYYFNYFNQTICLCLHSLYEADNWVRTRTRKKENLSVKGKFGTF